jgi:hypothetical protein
MSSNKPDRKQSQRDAFIRTARELGCDVDQEAFERAVRRVASRRMRTREPDKGGKTAVDEKQK